VMTIGSPGGDVNSIDRWERGVGREAADRILAGYKPARDTAPYKHTHNPTLAFGVRFGRLRLEDMVLLLQSRRKPFDIPGGKYRCKQVEK